MKKVLSILALTLSLIQTSAQADAMKWIKLGAGLGGLFGLSKDIPPRPSDWTVYALSIEDSRYPFGHKKRKACDRELIEITYPKNLPRRGTVLLLSGFMENAHAWDLAPEQGISYARWLMQAKGLKVYMLNIRGVGLSCYPSKSNLDDIAIDDLPAAMTAISDREGKENFVVIGHSMGGIALQASLAGLDRCDDGKNCFRPEKALARQARIDGIAVEGASVEFRVRGKEVSLKASAQFERLLKLMPSILFDRISAKSIQNLGSQLDPLLDNSKIGNVLDLVRDPLLHFLFWRYFYSAPNVNAQTRELFKQRVLDATNRGTLDQYSVALRKGGMRANGGEKYSDNLINIKLPVAQAVFERDAFADWEFAENDNFNRLGSTQKFYFRFAGEGHQDFMLNSNMHVYQSDMIDWLMGAAAAN